LLKLQNQVIGEVLNSQNVTHRLEKELLEQKLEHVQQEFDIKDMRLSLVDMRAETRKIWDAVSGRSTGTRMRKVMTSGDVLPSIDVQPYEVMKLGGEVDRTSSLVGQLRNSVGDLKAEWLLIKREVNGMKSENLQMKFRQNDLKADTVKLKSLIEGIRSQTSLIRNELDDVTMTQESMGKLVNDYKRGRGGTTQEELSRLRNELIDIRARADHLENEVIRLGGINDVIRKEALDVLGGQRNISADDLARLLRKMAATSPENDNNHEVAEKNIPKGKALEISCWIFFCYSFK
jgi:predicted  nucleic acid-binding Zn-ribbon protein